jgi:hypothetical protein
MGTSQSNFTTGSSLIWVMVVVLILIIVLAMGLAAASGRFNLSIVRHTEHQAYYTALSSTETVAAWITKNSGTETPEADKVAKLFDEIPDTAAKLAEGLTVEEAGLPSEAGACVVNLCWIDNTKTQLKITSTATVAGATETVSLTLAQAPASANPFETQLKTSVYNTTEADKRADELNTLTSGGIVALYDSSTSSNANSNATDKTLLDSYINTTSNREARWTNSELTSSKSNESNILGTQTYPKTGASSITRPDTRRFMVPANGRITIDPLEEDGYENKGKNVNADDANNTRITSLAIDNTAGKNVLFRLASGNAAMKGGLLNMSGTFQNRSSPRYAALVTLDFTDNAGSTEDLSYTINSSAKTYTWHPNHWKSLDLFVQKDGEVTSNLVFGPFGHKYGIVMDYYSWGDFVDNWNGTKANESEELWGVGGADIGIPIFPVDYGKDANFWILDGCNDRYLRIMQGANVLYSAIYSTRPTIIGGALIRAKDAYTTDGLNRALDGFADFNPNTHAMYVETTTRFSQLIYNTDIILKAPSSGTANSVICRPNTWRDRTETAKKVTAKDKEFEPTMTIKGGTIYVGKRQSLTIEGTVKDSAGVILDNMWISPDKIVVAEGGTLTLKKTEKLNVFTDIYVDGGTLIVESAAKMQGNIYVYNGGTMDMQSTFQLYPRSDRELNALLIYGADTVGAIINGVEITAPGKLIVKPTLPQINAQGRVHLVGGDWADLISGASVSLTSAAARAFLCDGYDETTGRCQHIDGRPASGAGSAWIADSFGSS